MAVPASSLQIHSVQAISNVRHEFMPHRQGNEPTPTLYMRGCRGERVNTAFYISGCSAVEKLIVEVVGAEWSDVSDLRWIKWWWQSGRVSFESDRPQYVPELLLHDGSLVQSNPYEVGNTYPEIPQDAKSLRPLDCDDTIGSTYNIPGFEQGVILTVTIPAYRDAGDYEFNLRVSAKGVSLVVVPIRLTVYPFDLPKPSVDYSMFYRSRFSKDPEVDSQNVDPEFRTEEQMLADLKNMVAHGCVNPRTYLGDGSLSRVLELRQEAGCNNSHLFSSVAVGHIALKDDFDRKRLPQLKLDYANLARKILAQCDGFGVKVVYGYGKDEAKLEGIHMQDPLWDAFSSVDGAEMSIATSGMSEKDLLFCKDYLPAVIARAGTWPTQKTTETLNARGIRTYVYGHPGPSESPEDFRRTMGILLHNRPWIAGSMEYALMHVWPGNEHSWDDFGTTSHYRSLMMVYPTIDGVVDTLQWEGYSEGVNDGRYLRLLKSLNSERADVKQFLQRVLQEEDTIDMDEMRYRCAELIIAEQEARK